MMTEGNLLGALLLAVLPVLIPELRLWVEMLRERGLQDRLSKLENEMKTVRGCRCSRRPRAEFIKE